MSGFDAALAQVQRLAAFLAIGGALVLLPVLLQG
jgi:hypothetical protein